LTRRPIEFVKTVALGNSRSLQLRGDAFRLLRALRRGSAFLVSAAALSVGVTPEYQVHVDSLR